MLRYSAGVGLGVMRVRVSGLCFIALLARRAFKEKARVNFIWLWRGWCLVVSMWHQGGVVCRACGSNAVVGP